MKTYIKFLIINFIKSFINILVVFTGLIIIINLLSELDFFKDTQVEIFFPIFHFKSKKMGYRIQLPPSQVSLRSL